MQLLSYGLLATALAMVTVQNLNIFIAFCALQAWLLGGTALAMGVSTGDSALYWAAGLTLVVKGIVIPLFLRYIIRQIRVMRVLDTQMTTKVGILIAVVLVLIAHWATASLSVLGGAGADTVPVALAMVLIGVFLIVGRRVALTQVIGLLVIENGLFLAALATTQGLPVLVDAGIIFDVLVTAVVTGLLIYRINATFESVDTLQLRRLRG